MISSDSFPPGLTQDPVNLFEGTVKKSVCGNLLSASPLLAFHKEPQDFRIRFFL